MRLGQISNWTSGEMESHVYVFFFVLMGRSMISMLWSKMKRPTPLPILNFLIFVAFKDKYIRIPPRNSEKCFRTYFLVSLLDMVRAVMKLKISCCYPMYDFGHFILQAACKSEPDSSEARRAVDLLYDTALISSGFSVSANQRSFDRASCLFSCFFI